MLAGTEDPLTWLSPVILNLESTGLTHLESEIRDPFRIRDTLFEKSTLCLVGASGRFYRPVCAFNLDIRIKEKLKHKEYNVRVSELYHSRRL